MYLLILFSLLNAHAMEVVKYESNRQIELKIVRAEPDSFGTYALMNHNGREMILVCANNIVYDNNSKAFIEYRNYYNEIAGNFILETNKACEEMGKFIENIHSAISEEHPFIIQLSTKTLKVEKIVYPQIDPFSDDGDVKDLLPKKPIFVNSPKKETRIKKTKRPEIF